MLYKKQFGLQSGHSTDHAINQLADYVLQSFEKNYFTLGIFIDLSKAFDTVDHSILLRKVNMYGRHGKIFLGLRVTYRIEYNSLKPRIKLALTCNN